MKRIRLLAVAMVLALLAGWLAWIVLYRHAVVKMTPPGVHLTAPKAGPQMKVTAPLNLEKVGPPYPWAGILASNRATDWTYAGIVGNSTLGTLPSDGWTQCGPTISAYSGTGTTILNAMQHTSSGYTGCGANTYVQLAAGTFTLSTGIYEVGVSNTELRGMGADQTHLAFTGNSTCQGGNGSCMIGFDSSDNTDPTSPGPSTILNWTSGYAKGSTVLSVSNLQNITANVTEAVMDQCDTGYSGATCAGTAVDNGQLYDCGDKYATTPTGCSVNGPDTGLARPHRFELEAAMITACSPACGTNSAGTITIDTPLVNPDWGSRTPQVWLFTPLQHVGLQNFSVDDSAVQSNIGGISFKNSANFWIRGVAVLHAYNIGIYLVQSIHGDVTSNYVFDAGQDLTYDDPTGIKYNWSSNLIANNIIQAVRPALMCEGPCGANVVMANYTINSYTGDDFLFGGEWDGHSNGADYALIESNVVDQLTEDLIHGGHWMQTNYRNFSTGWESCANGQCGSFTAKDVSLAAVSTQSYNRYPNYVGNILGTPGLAGNSYQISSGTCAGSYLQSAPVIWILNCGNGGTTPVIPGDTTGLATVFRYWNWDSVNASTQCNNSEVPSGLSLYANPIPSPGCGGSYAASFYYFSRPAWWSSGIPFPAIGPDVSAGNVGQVPGTLGTSGYQSGTAAINGSVYNGLTTASAWAGHINAIPAMACYLNTMHGPPDGSGSALTFNANNCYNSSTPTAAVPVFTPPGASSGSSTQPYGTVVNLTTASSGCASFIFWGSTNPPTNNGTTFTILGPATIYGQVQGCPGYLNSPVGSIAYTLTAPPAPTNVSVIQNQ